METSLHRDLKRLYADSEEQTEVRLGNYRIDAIAGEQLIEIQHGSLSAIRDKIRSLVKSHQVKVVKPIIARKRIIRQKSKGGPVLGRRLSPKRGSILELFDELIYFTRVFPHPNLALEAPLVEVDELRYPGHGRRRRRRAKDHVVEDQRLVKVQETHQFSTATDLLKLVPRPLPSPFHTGHLAEAMDVERWFAQRIAYCFRKMGAVEQVGKQGNALLYERSDRKALPQAG